LAQNKLGSLGAEEVVKKAEGTFPEQEDGRFPQEKQHQRRGNLHKKEKVEEGDELTGVAIKN